MRSLVRSGESTALVRFPKPVEILGD